MKTFLRILFLFLLITQICFAQWYQQNSGTTATLNAVYFEDAINGWAVGDSGIILHTINGGQNWIKERDQSDQRLFGIYFINQNYGCITGIDNSLNQRLTLKTTTGGTIWTTSLSDSQTYPLKSLIFIDQQYGWGCWPDYLNGAGILSKTTSGGDDWTDLFFFNNWISSVFFVDRSIGWIAGGLAPAHSTQTSKINKTTDSGITWSTQLDQEGGILKDIKFLNENIGWAVGRNGIIVKTTDGGSTWYHQLTDTSKGELLSVYFVNENYGWVVGYKNEQKILRTTNGGETWIEQQIEQTAKLFSLQFIDTINGWAVGENGTILHTTNSGVVPVELTSFTAEAMDQRVFLKWSTATELNNNGFEIQRRVAESDFATTGFVRGEGTTTNQREYSYIDKDLADGKYYYRLKQVDYNGSYEYSNVIEVDVRSLNEYALEQNYPNPFNPTTTIGYVLKEKTIAKLILLNAIGEEVAVLVNEEQEKGFHKIDFNANTLASGVYFFRLQAGDFVQTRKMILLK